MVDDFRWLARPQQGQAAPEVSLQAVIADALDELPDRLDPALKERLKRPVADLVGVEITQELPLSVRGRPGLLRRVIENLLQNAWEAVIKHKEPNAYDVAIRLFAEDQRIAVIEILDRGAGVANGKEVFEPYYTTKGARGLGLGLAIAKQVIEAHQGSIRALERSDGTGACFRIELPQATTASGDSLGISEDTST
jgi:C4-dicarboxylate-specific signal transduction histidine kinase